MVPVELTECELESQALDADMVQLRGKSVELRSPGGPVQGEGKGGGDRHSGQEGSVQPGRCRQHPSF